MCWFGNVLWNKGREIDVDDDKVMMIPRHFQRNDGGDDPRVFDKTGKLVLSAVGSPPAVEAQNAPKEQPADVKSKDDRVHVPSRERKE